MRVLLALLLLISLLFLSSEGKKIRNWYVQPGDEDEGVGVANDPFTSVALALDHAYEGDTITLLTGTYTGRGRNVGLTITRSFVIEGDQATVNCEGVNACFYVMCEKPVVFRNLYMINGDLHAIDVSGRTEGTHEIITSTFEGFGGAIVAVDQKGDMTITESQIQTSQVMWCGHKGGHALIQNCQVDGGEGSVSLAFPFCSASIVNNTFGTLTARTIFTVGRMASLQLENSGFWTSPTSRLIENNGGSVSGRSLNINLMESVLKMDGGSAVFTETQFSTLSPETQAVSIKDASLYLFEVSFIDIASEASGGAINAMNSDISLLYSSFSNVNTRGSGGALYLEDGTSLIVETTFFLCSASREGGAIYYSGADGFAAVTDCVASECTALSGAVIFCGVGDIFASFDVLRGNEAKDGRDIAWCQ